LVRMGHERALLERHPLQGVTLVEAGTQADMAWSLLLVHPELPGTRRIRLAFPPSYPHQPPAVELCGTAASGEAVRRALSLPCFDRWTALDDVRVVVESALGQLVEEHRMSEAVGRLAQEYFALIDTDGDGVVGMGEGKEAIKALYGIDDAPARAVWMRILAKTDGDRDGVIDAQDWGYLCSHAASRGQLPILQKQLETIRKRRQPEAGGERALGA
jgi:ubiquitin-protein ligase